MSVHFNAVSVSRNPKIIRFGRMWKINESGLAGKRSATPVSIRIRQGVDVGRVLGEDVAALLASKNVIRDGLLHLDMLDSFLTGTTLQALKHAGMKLRVGNEFDLANTREAIIGRLAEEDDDYFSSKYGEKHRKTVEAISSLMQEDIKAWQEKRKRLAGLGIDLSGANLSGGNFKRADLRGINFYLADLSDASFRSANFSGADLTGVNLWGADLSFAQLIGTKLPCADLSYARLYSVKLMQANLIGAILMQAMLRKADLCGAELENATLASANLQQAKLRNADLSHALANLSDFTEADCSGADLSGTEFFGANFSGATLSGATLTGTNFAYAFFSQTQVQYSQKPAIIARPIYGEDAIRWVN